MAAARPLADCHLALYNKNSARPRMALAIEKKTVDDHMLIDMAAEGINTCAAATETATHVTVTAGCPSKGR
jgi:hypothetical protein